MLITILEVAALFVGVFVCFWLFRRAVPTAPGTVLGPAKKGEPKMQHDFFANRRKPSFG